MSSLPLTALALLAFLHPHPRPTPDQTYELGSWRLDVHHDGFRRQVRCRISDDYGHFPSMIATREALILKLPNGADGSKAWFSVDGAPAKPWRDVEATLLASGSLAQVEALDNGTGGELPLPYAVFRGGKVIVVQIDVDGPFRAYSIGRLWDVLRSARGLGCDLGTLLKYP